MQAGLFGGTFNPIHNGHLMVAQTVVHRFALDRFYFIPCRVPPHKVPIHLAPAADRARMVRLALPMDTRYHLSDVELQRSGPSYTIDTVDHFTRQVLPGTDVYLVMGLDAFIELHTWKQFQRLLTIIQPVVVARRLPSEAAGGNHIHKLSDYIRSRLADAYEWLDSEHCWRHPEAASIHWLPVPPMDVSSSQVRRCIRAGRTITDLVPTAVSAYIEQKDLYQ